MKITKAAKQAVIEACERITSALQSEDAAGMTPLQMYAWLKRAQSAADGALLELKEQANAEFETVSAEAPNNKAWPVGDFALVARYEPPGIWIYPKELIKLEAELKSEKEVAKLSGAAKRIDPPFDPKATAFKVQLLKV